MVCSMLYIMTHICLGTEKQILLNKRIWEKFLEGALTYSAWLEKSVIQCWMQMVSSYWFICDYTFMCINNVSGWGPWWDLTEHEQKHILAPPNSKSKKVSRFSSLLFNCRYFCWRISMMLWIWSWAMNIHPDLPWFWTSTQIIPSVSLHRLLAMISQHWHQCHHRPSCWVMWRSQSQLHLAQGTRSRGGRMQRLKVEMWLTRWFFHWDLCKVGGFVKLSSFETAKIDNPIFVKIRPEIPKI